MDQELLYKELAKQKEEMTEGERMRAYMQGQKVDCQPYGLLAPDDAFASIWGFTKGQMKRSFEVRKEIIRRKKDEYGMEGLGIPLGLRGMGEAIGSKLVYPENRENYVDQHILQDYKDLEMIEQMDMTKNVYLLRRLEEGKRMLEAFPKMGISTDCAGPITTAIAVRPVDKVLRDMRKHPEELHRLLQACVNHSLQWIEMFYKETGSSAVGFADPVTTTDIMGNEYFREFSKPYLKKLIDGIVKITGNKPSIHICGHTKKILEDLVEIGMVSFSIDNCESMKEAKDMIGTQVFLSGNVAPVDVMQKGTIDDVIHAVRTCLEEGADSPCGYMLTTGCQLPIGTPKENIDAYIYAARKYGRGACMGQIPRGIAEEG